MRIDLTLNPQENILALVQDANPGLTITLAQVTVGAPAPAADGAARNSTVTLTAVANAGFAGDIAITYNRLALTDNVAVVPDSVQILGDDSEAVAGGKVAAALGLVAGEYTTTAFTAPVNEDTPGTITLTPADGSLLYVGDAVVMTLTIADADVPLATAVANTEMNGFDPATTA